MYAPSLGMITGTAIGSRSVGARHRGHGTSTSLTSWPRACRSQASPTRSSGSASASSRSRPARRVPDDVRIALREHVERDGEVRVAEDLQLLPANVARDERGGRRRRLPDVGDPCSRTGDGHRGLERRAAEQVEHERRRRAVDRSGQPLLEARRRRARRSRPRRARQRPRAGPRRARRRRRGPRRAASRPGRRPTRRSRSRRARARPRRGAPGASHESDIHAARPTWPSAAATRSDGSLRNLDQHLVDGDEPLGEGAVARDAEAAPGGPDARPWREAARTARRAPTPSIPGTYGSGGLPAGKRPDAIARSAGLSAAASSSTTAWPSDGCGSARSPSLGRSSVRGDDRGAQRSAGRRPRRRA